MALAVWMGDCCAVSRSSSRSTMDDVLEITPEFQSFIEEQSLFFVGSAPLSCSRIMKQYKLRKVSVGTMRGTPHRGFSRDIFPISSRISLTIFGRPRDHGPTCMGGRAYRIMRS